MKPKIYLETTIISYLASHPSKDIQAASMQAWSHDWWNSHKNNYNLYASDVVVKEAKQGDEVAVKKRLKYLADSTVLNITTEIRDLAAKLTEKHLPPKAFTDALHISASAVNGIDYILTWNIRHIANPELRRGIVDVCHNNNYECPVICSPRELMQDGN